ncbi:hypothetical protein XA68_17199 [Ophiocordyceps unilateralis]|uniref:Manganese/iron superoxide dismutase C-terminal domain-containing protein n=1 Tax=Ophiocordyceps unilateralis TaxID=268505 RepID=A0A2A9P596_OPHUN|nr:hypothetical protein XA68_17199 [Ophiocordyceps unilateralis]
MFRSLFRIPRCRPSAAPRVAAAATAAAVAARRRLHALPRLNHDFSNGLEGFMTPEGFSVAWTYRQTSLLEKVNRMVGDTERDDMDLKTLILNTAREPSLAALFNNASMAYNNNFYFDCLSPTPDVPIPTHLSKELEASFSSIETMRREFIITADAMFGPGFIWLVKTGVADYRLLVTYLAGSPFSGAHWRHQPSDLNTVGYKGTAYAYFHSMSSIHKDRDLLTPPGGIDVEPLLCLNTWEHAWLHDWGFAMDGVGGKLHFAESWWRYINWEVVSTRSKINREFKKDT